MKFKVDDIVVLTDPHYWVPAIIGAEVRITSIGDYCEGRLTKIYSEWKEGTFVAFPPSTVRLSETNNVQQLLDRYDD